MKNEDLILLLLVVMIAALFIGCWAGYDVGKQAADKWYVDHPRTASLTLAIDTTKPGICRAVLLDSGTHKELVWSEAPMENK